MPIIAREGTTVNAVTDLGIANDNSIDVTNAINNALATYGRVYLPAGNYRIGGGTQMTTGNPNVDTGIAMYLTNPTSANLNTTYDVHNGKRLCGAGPNATMLTVSNTTSPGITVYPNAGFNPTTIPATPPSPVSSCSIGDLTISRSSLSSTADGLIVWGGLSNSTAGWNNLTGASNQIILYNIVSELHNNGFKLYPTYASYVDKCYAQNNQASGFLLTNMPNPTYNTVVATPLQWTLNNTSSQNNQGWGYLVQAYPATSLYTVNLNPWNYPFSTGNMTGGIAVVAVNQPGGSASTPRASVSNFTVINGFLNMDSGPGIYLNTNGITHRIMDTHIEFEVGSGIFIDGLNGPVSSPALPPNGNADVLISGSSILGCTQSGIAISGQGSFNIPHGQPATYVANSEVQISSCRVTNNSKGTTGTPSSPPYYCGIDCNNPSVASPGYGGLVAIMGCRIGNDFISTGTPPLVGAQYAGISLSSNLVFVSACDLTRNGPGGPYINGTLPTGSGSNRLS